LAEKNPPSKRERLGGLETAGIFQLRWISSSSVFSFDNYITSREIEKTNKQTWIPKEHG
jgi:hypothetical protein